MSSVASHTLEERHPPLLGPVEQSTRLTTNTNASLNLTHNIHSKMITNMLSNSTDSETARFGCATRPDHKSRTVNSALQPVRAALPFPICHLPSKRTRLQFVYLFSPTNQEPDGLLGPQRTWRL